MRVGIVVLCIFGAIWGIAAVLLERMPVAWIALPLVISAGVLLYAVRGPSAKVRPGPHVGRLVGIWSAVEGAAMFIAANGLIQTGHRDALMPAFAIIVGLHFLPLARGIPVRVYFATAAALVVAGLIGLLAPVTVPLFIGASAAAILWATALALARGTA